jgi:hypothetical protein
LRPLDGERAENRLWCEVWLWVSLGAADDKDVTELVEAFRSPAKDKDSRFLRTEAETGAETWRGTRDEVEAMDGEARTDMRWVGVAFTVFRAGFSALESKTPNSSMWLLVVAGLGAGDTLAIEGVTEGVNPLTFRLVRRAVTVETDDTEPFSVGDGIPVGPLMRGILVGVSLDREDDKLSPTEGGKLGSLKPPFVLSAVVATDGEPAIVGSWFRELRSEASDCLCKELIVCAVALEPPPRLEMDETGVDTEELRPANRCAVA